MAKQKKKKQSGKRLTKRNSTISTDAAKLRKLRDAARRKKSLEATGLPGQITNSNRIKALANFKKSNSRRKR